MVFAPNHCRPYQPANRRSDSHVGQQTSVVSSYDVNKVSTQVTRRRYSRNGDVFHSGVHVYNNSSDYMNCKGDGFSNQKFKCLDKDGVKISIKPKQQQKSPAAASRSYVDVVSRVLFPTLYLIFNVAYWLSYSSHRPEYPTMVA